ncbi:MAG: bifunctional alpha,alpha-trehalose-phosphate synthase (UDP-forming)/trehalose-phosphatase [candidate division Zixibacteria bacterium]|nr:bifunctional alpha,alpha-trehalose-phosphate synthase (UDP-forming)/trehalose-phosphatase [candidate division Zixibacteria bacterium]NIR67589.1 bifunctional alpha,alpha-trehalose-phosphate synthase (UDP-forming)/trehalose-phosphatase [candidate division Zixibacteria bacterium]NIS16320.1 bifunctional alpha,alpha-trehalose-phosphate synthase (UDP-forming)/trehalose-phosphatase [candidate division Zixibacteria bacterium]NIS48850.1 bifunctional alpha,alpha-trehalose-phosphate synthase (UDP-formin
MGKLFIISNRLPVTLTVEGDDISAKASSGGLATGLSSFYKDAGGLWFGWPGISYDDIGSKTGQKIEKLLREEHQCGPVQLTEEDLQKFYYGFSNKTIWPLSHYFTNYTVFDNDLWEAYKRVNQKFCDTVVEEITDDDVIWVNDYQLMLLPLMLRQKLPNASIGYFHHIPFPSFELFRLMPWRREILEGLLGADLIGFHTYDYVRHFLSSVRRILGYENILGVVSSGYRTSKVDAFPMGIDYEKFSKAAKLPEVREEIDKLWRQIGDRKIVVSIDRQDYTKGIKDRLEAFHIFLHRYPEYREKVTLIMVTVPSRSQVPSYSELKSEIDELVGKINGEHGTLGWMPIWYHFHSVPFPMLIALYSFADIALVTPLRDGMNLVAKEFVATRPTESNGNAGVLIISEMAGAEKELGEAVIVNPFDHESVADSLAMALKMPSEEQRRRIIPMQKRLQRYDITKWAGDFLDSLDEIKSQQNRLYSKKLTGRLRQDMFERYNEASSRLFLLDYDGSLKHLVDDPMEAVPDDEVLEILSTITSDEKNELVVVSGRDSKTLDEWFGHLNAGMIANHGAWLKHKGQDWEMLEPLDNEWMKNIRPIMQLYVDRTPGSHLEEKEFSLVFHYRRAVPEMAQVRVSELKDDLRAMTSSLNLGILEGSKVIEIKNTNINKGNSALRFISKAEWDFVMAIGDDWTDEDMFVVLPGNSYSIKVGLVPSNAKYHLDSVDSVRAFLKNLFSIKH